MRTFAIKLVSALALSLFAFVGFSFAEDKAMTPLDVPKIGDMEALKPGESAPAFELKDTSGVLFKFDPLKSTPAMLVFWSIFCEPCQAEMPMIQGVYDKYKASGFNVFSVALDGDMADNIRAYAKQNGYNFTMLLDKENKDGSLDVAEKYMVPGTPAIYLIDRAGKITYSNVGRVGEAQLEKGIKAIVAK